MRGQGSSGQPKNILAPVVFLFPEQTARRYTLREKKICFPNHPLPRRVARRFWISFFFFFFFFRTKSPTRSLGLRYFLFSHFARFMSLQERMLFQFLTKRKLGEKYFFVSRFKLWICLSLRSKRVVSLTFHEILASFSRYDAHDATLRLSGRTDSWKQVESIGSYDRGIRKKSLPRCFELD